MNKFETVMSIMTQFDSRQNPYIPIEQQPLYMMVHLMDIAHRAGALPYKCSVDQSLLDEVLAHIPPHMCHDLLHKMLFKINGFGARMTGPASNVGFGVMT
jgi:hypothetical protein